MKEEKTKNLSVNALTVAALLLVALLGFAMLFVEYGYGKAEDKCNLYWQYMKAGNDSILNVRDEDFVREQHLYCEDINNDDYYNVFNNSECFSDQQSTSDIDLTLHFYKNSVVRLEKIRVI